MRFVHAAIATFGIVALITVLASVGFSRPKAIFGALLVILVFGSIARSGFASARSSRQVSNTKREV